jgi:uncharacterized YigZ family protein
VEEFLVPTADALAEFTEKRSRFLGHIFLTDTEEAALACIRQVRQRHYDATHNVYAYVLHGGTERCSDDGEPQGTAGVPVLEVLRRAQVSNVCCVVTRYFGGILLGAGGLVRAYAKSASQALAAAGLSRMQCWTQVALSCPYALFERVKLCAERLGGQLSGAEYGEQILLRYALPEAQAAVFVQEITDLSCGKVRAEAGGQEYRAFPLK